MYLGQIKKAENVILKVVGGIGKNIVGTVVVRNLRKMFPDKRLIVLASCPDIFIKNPHVDRVINFAQPYYFYEDYMMESKSVILDVEPYQHYDYVYRNKPVAQCWCEMLGLSCDNIIPEIHFSDTELKMAQIFLNRFDREMILFHHTGGKIPQDKTEKEDIASKAGMYKRSLTRETSQKVVDKLIGKGFMVGCVQHENQFLPSGGEKINFPLRAIMALVPYVAGVICIDSFLQHACAGAGKKAIVFWGGTNPKVLGYSENINITRKACDTPMCHRPNSYMFDFEPTGFMWDCPHDDACMDYTAEKVIKEFDKLTGGRNGEERKPGDRTRAESKKDTASKTKAKDTRTKKSVSGSEKARPNRRSNSTRKKVSKGAGSDRAD